jgi:hypothetical protein
MIPRILEYDNRRVKITPEAYAIPELKKLIDKYKKNPEPYLSYVHSLSAPDSPYINIPAVERTEAVIYDIQATLGDFDFEEELLQAAVERMKSFYTSPVILAAEQAAEELHKLRIWLRDTPYQDEESVKTRMSFLKDLEKVVLSYRNVRKQADEDLKVATKGDHELGGYFD